VLCGITSYDCCRRTAELTAIREHLLWSWCSVAAYYGCRTHTFSAPSALIAFFFIRMDLTHLLSGNIHCYHVAEIYRKHCSISLRLAALSIGRARDSVGTRNLETSISQHLIFQGKALTKNFRLFCQTQCKNIAVVKWLFRRLEVRSGVSINFDKLNAIFLSSSPLPPYRVIQIA
jgi:hypothetical protein